MPEIIEVRLYADFINKLLKNHTLINIKILNGRYKKHKPFKGYYSINNQTPLSLNGAFTKGKFMYLDFDNMKDNPKDNPINNIYIGITLGLSGGWFFKENKSSEFKHGLNGKRYKKGDESITYMNNALKHLNVQFTFDNGILYFYDQLSYGTINVYNKNELNIKLNKIGLDLMDNNITFDMFYNKMNNKKIANNPIGNVLMNQKILAGIGNYLRADVLWLSKISPFRKLKNITLIEYKKIYHNIRLLIWGQYNKTKGIKLGIINKKDKLPIDYNRNFFVYNSEFDIYNNPVIKEKLYEGKQIRYIYWTKNRQT